MTALEGFEHIVRQSEPLARHTWFRLGGMAEMFAEPTSIDELSRLLARCKQLSIPVRVLGGGSNILVRDQGVSGMVLSLTAPAFGAIEVEGQQIRAGAGARLGHVISTAAREGLAGLESLVGIPGSVGGALRGNSDSHGTSIGQWTSQVRVLTQEGTPKTYERGDLQFGYRQSNLDRMFILEGAFQLDREDSAVITRRLQKLWIVRRASTPSSPSGLGRLFKDPLGIDAASLIEQVGMKGVRQGGAEIYAENPNFIVTHPGATSSDVIQLTEEVRHRVAEHLGVELELEIQIW